MSDVESSNGKAMEESEDGYQDGLDEKPQKRSTRKKRNNKSRNNQSKSSRHAIEEIDESQETICESNSRRSNRRTNTQKSRYNEEEDDQRIESLMVMEVEADETRANDNVYGNLLDKEVEQILWKAVPPSKQSPHLTTTTTSATGTPREEFEYFVKFKDYSYLHCEWMSYYELATKAKSKLNRFDKTFDQRSKAGDLDEEASENGVYFDPTFSEVDRVVKCCEMFPIIHRKKAGEAVGQWYDLLTIFMQKLLTFTKSNVHYGIHLMEFKPNSIKSQTQSQSQGPKSHLDLGTISNRVYLNYYTTPKAFFSDLATVFKNIKNRFPNVDSDIRIVSETLREAVIVCYKEWHELSQKRYSRLIEEIEEISQNGIERGEEYQMKKRIERDHREKIEQSHEIKEEQQFFTQRIIQKFKRIMNSNKVASEIEIENDSDSDSVTTAAILNCIQLNAQPITEYLPELNELADSKLSYTEIKLILDRFISAKDNSAETNNINDNYDDDDSSDQIRLFAKQCASKRRQLDQLIESASRSIDSIEANYIQSAVEMYNPGEFSLGWILGDTNKCAYSLEMFEYLNGDDIENLSFDVPIDMLYLVKWKNLSYIECTWEHESVINSPSKVRDYKMFNLSLNKETREALKEQSDLHLQLKQLYSNPRSQSRVGSIVISEMQNRLFHYERQHKREILQYSGRSIPIYKQRKVLRSYQVESLNWMIKSWCESRNVILADEMGLGKTIQSTAFLNHLYTHESVTGPFLVIAPLSLLEHWKRSVEEWTSLNAVLYYDHGGAEGRARCRQNEFLHTDISVKGVQVQAEDLMKFQVLITSNEVFVSDAATHLANIPFQFIVVDEAHRLKNMNARLLAALNAMVCKRTLLLTGTPIQNNTEELWTLLNYIEPTKFHSLYEFMTHFGDLKKKEQVEALQSQIKPYILRRMKEDVEDSIPPLSETIIDIEMTTIQKKLYRAIYERNKSMLQKNFSMSAMHASMSNLEMQLRKCCNHPFLIKEIEADLTVNCSTQAERFKVLIEASGKMILLDKLITKYKAEGKKVLVFSQFVYALNLIEEYLTMKEIKYEKIDGSVKSRDRQNAIDRFSDASKHRDVFLLSTKAGGLGINLTAANIVIIFDSDWNPQNDMQATARAHRIGQTQEVLVFRFITKKTYEAEMFERATKKLGLDQAMFLSGEFKTADGSVVDDATNESNKRKSETTTNDGNKKKLSKDELENLLKKGILGLMNEDEESKKSSQFFEDDIDAILKKNSRIAKYSVMNGSYSLSKGSFVSNAADVQLKMDDPNFWNIVLKGQASKSEQLLKELDDRASEFGISLDAQKEYFFRVCTFVNSIITAKLHHEGGFNADDESNIMEILNKIVAGAATFHLKYKEIADSLLVELARTTRRFKKITLEDLNIIAVSKKQQNNEENKSKNKESDSIPTTVFTQKQASQENKDIYEGMKVDGEYVEGNKQDNQQGQVISSDDDEDDNDNDDQDKTKKSKELENKKRRRKPKKTIDAQTLAQLNPNQISEEVFINQLQQIGISKEQEEIFSKGRKQKKEITMDNEGNPISKPTKKSSKQQSISNEQSIGKSLEIQSILADLTKIMQGQSQQQQQPNPSDIKKKPKKSKLNNHQVGISEKGIGFADAEKIEYYFSNKQAMITPAGILSPNKKEKKSKKGENQQLTSMNQSTNLKDGNIPEIVDLESDDNEQTEFVSKILAAAAFVASATSNPALKSRETLLSNHENSQKKPLCQDNNNKSVSHPITSSMNSISDFTRKLCYYCDRGKCTYFCIGPCHRSMHEECKNRIEAGWINTTGMDESNRVIPQEEAQTSEYIRSIANTTSFMCSDCKQNIGVCFVCKRKGTFYPSSKSKKQPQQNNKTSNVSEQFEVVKKCFTSNCHKYYHMKCLKDPDSPEGTNPLIKFIEGAQNRFRCASHYCSVCKNTTSDGLAIAQCVRCPKGFHLRCIEKEKVVRLAKKAVICENHVHHSFHAVSSQTSILINPWDQDLDEEGFEVEDSQLTHDRQTNEKSFLKEATNSQKKKEKKQKKEVTSSIKVPGINQIFAPKSVQEIVILDDEEEEAKVENNEKDTHQNMLQKGCKTPKKEQVSKKQKGELNKPQKLKDNYDVQKKLKNNSGAAAITVVPVKASVLPPNPSWQEEVNRVKQLQETAQKISAIQQALLQMQNGEHTQLLQFNPFQQSPQVLLLKEEKVSSFSSTSRSDQQSEDQGQNSATLLQIPSDRIHEHHPKLNTKQIIDQSHLVKSNNCNNTAIPSQKQIMEIEHIKQNNSQSSAITYDKESVGKGAVAAFQATFEQKSKQGEENISIRVENQVDDELDEDEKELVAIVNKKPTSIWNQKKKKIPYTQSAFEKQFMLSQQQPQQKQHFYLHQQPKKNNLK